MSEYDYANARIRGLRSRLLAPHDFDALLAQPTVEGLLAALASTDYGPDLEAARQRPSAVGGDPHLRLLDEAVAGNLARRLRGLRGYFTAPAAGRPTRASQLLAVLFARYDVQNVVAVLRGLAAGAAPREIDAALLPAGDLDASQLRELAGLPDVPACVAHLAHWELDWAGALATALPAYQETTAAGGGPRALPALELALRRGFAEWAARALVGRDPNTALVRDLLALEADAANVSAVLRLRRAGIRPEPPALAALLVPRGMVPAEALTALLAERALADAVGALRRTPLRRVLAVGAPQGAGLDEAVALELAVERYLARWAHAQVYRDPLGIGLAVAYHAAKVEEARALRLLARGLTSGWPRERLRHLLALSAA
jgi:vacuolar-type H+-ATPase subunit C/Vma6